MRKFEGKRRKEEEKARKEMLKIYALLEKNEVKKADAQFIKKQKKIEPFVSADALQMLQQTIRNSYAMLESHQRARDERARAVMNRELRQQKQEPLRENTGAPRPSSSFSGLSSDEAFERYERQQKQAQEDIVAIYSLLEQKKPREAYRKFQEVRFTLQNLICKEAFEMLEVSVKQANTYSVEVQPEFIKK
jgi:hypothetical protein